MEQNIATVLHLNKNQINVKATTEEGLGFTGAQLGIASQAICSLISMYEGSILTYDSQGQNCQGCKGCHRE